MSLNILRTNKVARSFHRHCLGSKWTFQVETSGALCHFSSQKVYQVYFPYNDSQDGAWDRPREPFAQPFVHNLSTGQYEQDVLQPYFSRYSDAVYRYFNVEQAGRYLWRYVSSKVSAPFYAGNHGYGFNCMKYGTRCMADNRDAQYFLNWPDVSELSNSSVFVMVGVVHSAMGKCQWENLVPYFANSGVHSKFYRSHYLDYLSERFEGSALAFPPGVNKTIPEEKLGKLFVVAAMRTEMCEKYFDAHDAFPELRDVPKFCFDGNDFNYSAPQRWFMVHRCYINPETQTRPDANEMIPFVTMRFEAQWFDWGTA